MLDRDTGINYFLPRIHSYGLGIDWMTKREINEAIPPAYAEYIGRELMKHLRGAERGTKDQVEGEDQWDVRR